MKKIIAAAACCVGIALPAGAPAGFHYWSSSTLKGYAKSLAPKIDAAKVATQPLATAGNSTFMMAHREGPGQAEFHETVADIFVVQSGEATLVYGGSLVNGKTTAPHEMRAEGINGGMEQKIGPGDVVAIPAKVPHQVKLDSGKQFTYFVVKVTQ